VANGAPDTYVSLTGEREDRRLDFQNRALARFDADVYARVLGKSDCPAVLDVGCGSGGMLRSVLPKGQACRLVGVDGFDVISCSMVLLHLHDPLRALERLHALMAPGAAIVVRDVDDGVGFAWPDPDGRFARYFDILGRDARMGDRRFGRKAFALLRRAGYANVRIERQGLTTADVDDPMDLYRMAFPTMLDYVERRHREAPGNDEWARDYAWFRDNIAAIRRAFEADDFVFSPGFMSLTATA
jgi:SAM-dependent methyltransferase